MKSKRLLIYCAGGMGREILELARQTGHYQDILFLDDGLCGATVNGAPVYELEQIIKQGVQDNTVAVVASGEPTLVRRLTSNIQNAGIPLEILIHPTVYVPQSSIICPGVLVQDRVFLGPNSTIEMGACIDYNCALGHDVTVEKFSHISMGCMVAGHVTIKEGTYIGAGTVIRDEVTIGRNCIIGMGSVVTKDIPDNTVAYGNPCRVVRKNTDGIVFQ